MFIKTHNFTATALLHFRNLQRTSFAILEETAASLVGGETEKEVAHILVKRYRSAGAGSFFHLPVVLFGERTALYGIHSRRQITKPMTVFGWSNRMWVTLE